MTVSGSLDRVIGQRPCGRSRCVVKAHRVHLGVIKHTHGVEVQKSGIHMLF
jgi:hypothetical protein